MPLIECRQIACRYGAKEALKDVTFSAEEGSWTYVLGPSASGKTTLLRAVAGLKGLASGEILLDKRAASNRRNQVAPHERRVGFLFQEPSLWPHLNATANVALGVRERGLSRRVRFRRAEEWLERLQAGHLAPKFPAELSGGESRTVALARSVASRPRILLLDEPTAHLDMHFAERMMERLIALHSELGLTTLCVTHQFAAPMRAADRTLILDRGRIFFDGPFQELPESRRDDGSPHEFLDALRRRIE